MGSIGWTASADVAESNLRQLANSVAAHPYGRRDVVVPTDRDHPSASALGLDPLSLSPSVASSAAGATGSRTPNAWSAAGRSRQMSMMDDGSPAPFSYLMDLEDYYYNELLMLPQ
jgi:hypothetical protein